MSERLINLSTHQVQRLREDGLCTWTRDCKLGQPLPYAKHEVLLGRESVAETRTEGPPWYYLADGKEPKRFYLKNYLAPRASCRLRVEVTGSWYEQDDAENWSYHFTLKLLSDASVSSD